jgi:hypothetical protein
MDAAAYYNVLYDSGINRIIQGWAYCDATSRDTEHEKLSYTYGLVYSVYKGRIIGNMFVPERSPTQKRRKPIRLD